MEINKYEDYTIASEDGQQYILEKENSFYRLNREDIELFTSESEIIEQKYIKENYIYSFTFIAIMLACFYLYFTNNIYTIVDDNFWIATLLLLINIPIHELGHVLFLKVFYPKARIKIGFKLAFIYPAFYVDTSYSYMLPKYKRIAVYLAGNVMNSIFIIIIILLVPNLLPYCYLIITNILINFIPIMKCDGYYALMTLFNKHIKAKGGKKEFIEDFIRGFIMFLFLSFISYIS